METVYRINTVGCHKPWRSTSEYLLTDKELFEQVKACDDGDFYRIPAPGAITDEDHPDYDEDNTLAEWLFRKETDNIKMPYILADEFTFYTE